VYEADLVTAGERLRLLRLGWLRGSYLTSIDFLHPIDRWDTYADLRTEVIQSIEMKMPAAVVRALDELLGDTMMSGGEVLPYLDVVASRPVSEPRELLRVAAEVARVGENHRALRLLEALENSSFLPGETRFWRLWVQHHIEGKANEDALARSRELLRSRPGSLLTIALAWSIAEEAGEEAEAQKLLDEISERWPRRAATLAARSSSSQEPDD